MKPVIDALFSAPGLPAVRQVAALEPPDVGEFERDRLRILDAFDRDDRVPGAGYVFDQTAREDLEKLHGAVDTCAISRARSTSCSSPRTG